MDGRGRGGRGGRGRGRAGGRGRGAGDDQEPVAIPPSWPVYFPRLRFAEDDRRAELVAVLARFFSSEIGFELIKGVRTHHLRDVLVALDFTQLKARADIPDLFAALELAPPEAMLCLRAAIHEVVFNSPVGRRELPHMQIPAPAVKLCRPPVVDVHLINHPEARVTFRNLRSTLAGKIVTLRGQAVRVSPASYLAKTLQFTCDRCDTPQTFYFTNGLYDEPESCAAPGCRSKKFTPDRDSVKCADWQRIRLQELIEDVMEDDDYDGRGQARFADIEAEGTLVNKCAPGDEITVVGIVEMRNVEQKGSALERERAASQFELVVNALSVTRQRAGDDVNRQPLSKEAEEAFRRGLPNLAAEDAHFGRVSEGWLGVEDFQKEFEEEPAMSPADLEFIVRFTEECDGEQFKQLVHSLCPVIYGQELVKAGIVLALFGGVSKKFEDDGWIPTRGSINCLVVGDPGMGKSQMLTAASKVANKGMYCCGGSGVSVAGLTAAVIKDPTTGQFTYEAGALVRSHGGVCCVDEFDKMQSKHDAFLETMEQQEVSIAKAGIVCTLPARASIVAAANPKGGQYNRSLNITDNLNMSPALLSRFDLIFILVDDADATLDEHRARHVLAPHGVGGVAQLKQAQQQLLAQYAHEDQEEEEARDREEDEYAGAYTQPQPRDDERTDNQLAVRRGPTLKQRLRLDLAGADEDFAPLPVSLMRKYITYARAYCFPMLSDEAGKILQDYYVEIRARCAAGADSVPITPRQMEALIRLAEARAKVDLRETVTAEDAHDAVEIMKEGMRDVLKPGGTLRGKGGKLKKSGKAKMFVDAMKRKAQDKDSAYFTTGELYALVDDLQLHIPDVDAFIDNLNMAGEILKSGRLWKVA